MPIEVKSISDLVSEYVSEVGKSSGAAMHMLWKEVAGKELALRKRKIISEFRRNFPDADITSMQIKRTY